MKKLSKSVKHREYFDNIGEKYVGKNLPMISFLKFLKQATRGYVRGEVLVVGSGGLINFDTSNITHIILTDVTLKTMKNVQTISGGGFGPISEQLKRKTKTSRANALKLPFSAGLFDTVIMFNVAHHLSGVSGKKSRSNVNTSISEIYRVLKKNGKLLLCEACPTLLPKIIQDWFYDLLSPIFLKQGKPIPYFLSIAKVGEILHRNSIELIFCKTIPFGGRVYQPIFPRLSPPGWLWKYVLPNKLFIGLKK